MSTLVIQARDRGARKISSLPQSLRAFGSAKARSLLSSQQPAAFRRLLVLRPPRNPLSLSFHSLYRETAAPCQGVEGAPPFPHRVEARALSTTHPSLPPPPHPLDAHLTFPSLLTFARQSSPLTFVNALRETWNPGQGRSRDLWPSTSQPLVICNRALHLPSSPQRACRRLLIFSALTCAIALTRGIHPSPWLVEGSSPAIVSPAGRGGAQGGRQAPHRADPRR